MSDCNTKQCTICKQWFPVTIEYFSKRKTSGDGFRNQCRECRHKQAMRPEVAERRRQKQRERYADDPEFRKRTLDDAAKRRKANPELTKTKKHDEYERHKERYSFNARKHYLDKRDEYLERARNQVDNPVAHNIRTQRRLARKRNLPDTFTKEEWENCLGYFNNRCAVCGKVFDDKCKAYMDHWIPLKSPKCPGTIKENIICLCGGRGGCNESKHSRKAELWLADFYSAEQAENILKHIKAYFEWVKG